jgi:hypothetical protein
VEYKFIVVALSGNQSTAEASADADEGNYLIFYFLHQLSELVMLSFLK